MTCRTNAPLTCLVFALRAFYGARGINIRQGHFKAIEPKYGAFPFPVHPVSALQGFEDAVHGFLLRYPVRGGIGREAFLGEG